MINDYDFEKTRENVEKLISTYKKSQFQYLVAENNLNNVLSVCYEPKYNQQTNNVKDKLGDNVGIKCDSKTIIDYFDAIFNPLFEKFSKEEKKYYSLYLINGNSEQYVADSLGISRTGLIPIKQNCILKIALAFHIDILKSK